MKELSEVNHKDFETCLNDLFTVRLEDEGSAEIELIEVKPLGDADPDSEARQPFSLLFRGPMEPVFAQQIFQLENAKLGELAIFLIPIGPDETGMLYDATFN